MERGMSTLFTSPRRRLGGDEWPGRPRWQLVRPMHGATPQYPSLGRADARYSIMERGVCTYLRAVAASVAPKTPTTPFDHFLNDPWRLEVARRMNRTWPCRAELLVLWPSALSGATWAARRRLQIGEVPGFIHGCGARLAGLHRKEGGLWGFRERPGGAAAHDQELSDTRAATLLLAVGIRPDLAQWATPLQQGILLGRAMAHQIASMDAPTPSRVPSRPQGRVPLMSRKLVLRTLRLGGAPREVIRMTFALPKDTTMPIGVGGPDIQMTSGVPHGCRMNASAYVCANESLIRQQGRGMGPGGTCLAYAVDIAILVEDTVRQRRVAATLRALRRRAIALQHGVTKCVAMPLWVEGAPEERVQEACGRRSASCSTRPRWHPALWRRLRRSERQRGMPSATWWSEPALLFNSGVRVSVCVCVVVLTC